MRDRYAKLADKLASEVIRRLNAKSGIMSTETIRSSLLPADVLDGTKIFVNEYMTKRGTTFCIETRWERFGCTSEIDEALGAFEDILLLHSGDEIDAVLKKHRIRKTR